MANITTVIYRNYILKYNIYITIFIIAIIFVIAAIFGYQWYSGSVMNPDPASDVSNRNARDKPISIYYFYTTWCPYCQKVQQEWLNFSKDYDQKEINGYVINCIKQECDNTNDPNVTAMMQQYNIEHFPTVKMVLDGNVVDFDARVSESNLVAFVKSVTQ